MNFSKLKGLRNCFSTCNGGASMMAPASEQRFSLKVARLGVSGAVIQSPGLSMPNWYS
jgi:hypothetical protein